jgi:hypothetical protein
MATYQETILFVKIRANHDKKSRLNSSKKITYVDDMMIHKVVYHHIIYIRDFFVNLDDFFIVVCTGFYKEYGFHLIRCLKRLRTTFRKIGYIKVSSYVSIPFL